MFSASVLCLSAIAAAGDIEFSGVGQTVVTSLDGVETLDTRLVLGAYGESEGAVYGFAFETNDNLSDTTLYVPTQSYRNFTPNLTYSEISKP